jgi:hypothetical protein
MEISNNSSVMSQVAQNSENKKTEMKEMAQKLKEQRREDALNSIPEMKEGSFSLSYKSIDLQMGVSTMLGEDKFKKDYEEFQGFLKDIGYEGKPIGQLSQDEATELVSEDGFFGVKQTSDRIANFVIEGAGEDENLLRAGREGVLQGYKDAEEMWGSKLPEISKQTIEKAVEKIDMRMHELGFSIIKEEA